MFLTNYYSSGILRLDFIELGSRILVSYSILILVRTSRFLVNRRMMDRWGMVDRGSMMDRWSIWCWSMMDRWCMVNWWAI